MSSLIIKDLNITAGSFKVKNINLTIEDHQYFVLMGHTGSGKSLLLKSICGLIDIDSGTIEMQGRDITKLEPRERQIGYVPQEPGLFPHLSVEENILFAPITAGIAKEKALEKSMPIINKLEIAYLLDRSVTNLSGGEKQKVTLARALAREPQLLVMDEPISAVDEPARKEICELLKKIQDDFQITIIHVCHNRAEALLLSHIIRVIDNGELLDADAENKFI